MLILLVTVFILAIAFSRFSPEERRREFREAHKRNKERLRQQAEEWRREV